MAIAVSLAIASCGGGTRRGDEDGGLDGGPDTGSDTGSDTPSGAFDELAPLVAIPGWTLAWAKRVGGDCEEAPMHAASDGSSFLVTGWFDGEVVFGEGEPNETVLDGSPEMMFLARYWPDSTLGWVSWAGDPGSVTSGLAVDAREDGTIALTGRFGDTAVFGAGEPGETLLEKNDLDCVGETAFAASYDEDGSLDWARAVQPVAQSSDDCGSRAYAWGAGALADGSVLVSGYFEERIALGLGEPGETVLVSAGASDGFFAKYDAAGDLAWARRLGGDGWDDMSSVEVLADGGFYGLGVFSGSVVFGQGELNEQELVSIGEESAFLARYTEASELVWAEDLGVDGDVSHASQGGVVELADGDVAVSGRFYGRMRAGDPESWEWAETLENGGGIFVSRYGPDGEWIWTSVATCALYLGMAWDVAPLADGSLVVVGNYDGDAVFGQGEPNETTLDFQGGLYDAFFALYGADGTLQWVLGWGSNGHDALRAGVEVLFYEETEVEQVYTAGFFQGSVVFGTGSGDGVELTSATPDDFDMMLLRLDHGDGGPPAE